MDFYVVHSAMLRGLFMAIGFGLLDAFFIYMLVMVLQDKKIFKKNSTKQEYVDTETKTDQKYERIVCQYCGSVIYSTLKKCPHCGGSQYEVKNIKEKDTKK